MIGPVAIDLTVFGVLAVLVTACGLAALYEDDLLPLLDDCWRWVKRAVPAPSAFASVFGWLRRIPWPLRRKRGSHARMEVAG